VLPMLIKPSPTSDGNMGIKFTPASATNDGKKTYLPFQEGTRPPVRVVTSTKRENRTAEGNPAFKIRGWRETFMEMGKRMWK